MLTGWCAPAAARADTDADAFGAEGQRVPFGRLGLELELAGGAPGTDDELGRDLSLLLSPGFLVFFARDLAAGASLDVCYSDVELSEQPFTEVELGASLGFGLHVPLGARVGLFPRLWIGGGYFQRVYDELPLLPRRFADPSFPEPELERRIAGAYASSQLLLPLVLHLAPATFIAAGPHARLRLAFEHGQRLFRFGLSASIGRYF